MAISPIPKLGMEASGSADPILRQVAETNTFDCDWEVLRKHFLTALRAALPIYRAKGPPPPIPTSYPRITSQVEESVFERSSPVNGNSPEPESGPSITSENTPRDDTAPPADSLLLSPSTPTQPLTPLPDESMNLEASSLGPEERGLNGMDSTSSSGLGNGMDSQLDIDSPYPPSTQGGLVIAPFPPLRRRNSSRSSDEGDSGESSKGMNGTLDKPGANETGGGPFGVSKAMLDDNGNDDIIIGGKTLPGWLEEDESKKELEKVAKVLEELDEPPFTIQRLAELLSSPGTIHTTLGKFLRALEKLLLVTSSWEPPSYNPQPGPSNSMSQSLFTTAPSASGSASTSSASSISSGSSEVSVEDEDSMMPPGSSTPMFSPIPFLARSEADMEIDTLPGTIQHNGLEDGLMSPLMLGGESSGSGTAQSQGFRFEPAAEISSADPNKGRSPTPEPEEDVTSSTATGAAGMSTISPSRASHTETTAAAANGTTPGSDPSHQSYLGRVDELDTGPIPSSSKPTSPDSAKQHRNGNGVERSGDGDEEMGGVGEGGNMVQHGMSEKPVPISSTTTMKDEERKIASLPKGNLGDRFVTGDTNGSEEPEGIEG